MDKALRSLIDWYDRIGVDTPDLPSEMPLRKKRLGSEKSLPASQAVSHQETKTINQAGLNSAEAVKSVKSLDELRTVMQRFDAGALSDGARQAVFSRGNPEADLMVIGEAPGRDEDIQGQPFVGRSGQLLDQMLAAIGLTDKDFYITNVVNWRPPKNRNPKPEEIALCRPFLDKHVELAAPKVLLLVGGVSMSALTGLTGIMKNHGHWQDVKIGALTLPALPLYHPAFLLRQPALKKEAWRDLLTLRKKLESL